MIVVSRYRKEIEAMIRRLIRMRRDKRDESELFSEDELAKFYDVLPSEFLPYSFARNLARGDHAYASTKVPTAPSFFAGFAICN